MPASMTYSQLVADIQVYADREDAPFVDQIPRFIMLAENRIASEVRGLGFIKVASLPIAQGISVVEKPARWRETIAIMITDANGGKRFLKQRGYGYLRAYWPDNADENTPTFYSDYDYEHFLIAPTPDDAYTLEVSYHERPAPLDDSNQTNWTTQYAPQLLLYAALLEAQPFLKLGTRTAEFQALYDRAAAAITAESQQRLMGDQTLMRTKG